MPAHAKPLEGRRFGRLLVLHRIWVKQPGTNWLCRCDCGKRVRVTSSNLTWGATNSCGCLRREKATIHGQTAGGQKHPLYVTWVAMQARCRDSNLPSYKYYGARGIKVCATWRKSFKAFLDDMAPRPPGTSLDRINTRKGYSKANCRWATRAEQSSNTRRSRYLTIAGQRKTVTEWARLNGIPPGYAFGRISTGWSKLDAVTRPVQRKRNLMAKRKIIEKVDV